MARAVEVLAVLVISGLGASRALAEDVVHYLDGDGRPGRVSGRIVDLTGEALHIELPGGQERIIRDARVLRVETDYLADQDRGDAAMAAGEFARALSFYRQALAAEERVWVRRQIIAQSIRCQEALGDWAAAGESFLALVRSDPQTLHFDWIPLQWIAAIPSPVLEDAARRWLESSEPAAVLLGASHLMPTASRGTAVARLGELAAHAEAPVAPLARAQLWRHELVGGELARVQSASRAIEDFPEPLRAGPYYVVGNAFLQHRQWEDAAIHLMRVPILYPRHRDLAARALLDAGRALERLERPEAAARLYYEILRDYPGSPAAGEARARLEGS